MAGSTSKIKRLKGAFDANLVTDDTFTAHGDEYNKDYDVHVIAGAFKWWVWGGGWCVDYDVHVIEFPSSGGWFIVWCGVKWTTTLNVNIGIT